MKRILILAALLAGCVPTTKDVESGGSRPLETGLYRDSVTGCEYLVSVNHYALTPRIAADGKTHMGCKGVQQ
jgi:hypothetical protein